MLRGDLIKNSAACIVKMPSITSGTGGKMRFLGQQINIFIIIGKSWMNSIHYQKE
jgi:hypothetical protein